MARHEFVLRSTLERGAGSSAGLSRKSCSRQRHGAGAGTIGQPAPGDRRAPPPGAARRAARACRHRADDTGPGTAGAVLSAAAGARFTVVRLVRIWLFRIRSEE